MARRIGTALAATFLVALVLPASAALAGGGCHTGATQGEGDTVEFKDACFTPSILQVDPGDSVTFVNLDEMTHNVGGERVGQLRGHEPERRVHGHVRRGGRVSLRLLVPPGDDRCDRRGLRPGRGERRGGRRSRRSSSRPRRPRSSRSERSPRRPAAPRSRSDGSWAARSASRSGSASRRSPGEADGPQRNRAPRGSSGSGRSSGRLARERDPGLLELQREVVGVRRGRESGVDRDPALPDEPEQALVERAHAVVLRPRRSRRGSRPSCRRRRSAPRCGRCSRGSRGSGSGPPSGVGTSRWHTIPRRAPASVSRIWPCCVRREEIDDAVHGLGGVQRCAASTARGGRSRPPAGRCARSRCRASRRSGSRPGPGGAPPGAPRGSSRCRCPPRVG